MEASRPPLLQEKMQRSNAVAAGGNSGAPIRVTVDIDFSAATADATVLLFDGNDFLSSLILAGTLGVAGKTTADYAAIGAAIAGSYKGVTLELLTKQSGNNPFVITNLFGEAYNGGTPGGGAGSATNPFAGYFGQSFTEYRANPQGNANPNTQNWPNTRPDQFTTNVRQYCNYDLVVDGFTGLAFPMKQGERLILTFFVLYNENVYNMQHTRQLGC